MHGRRRNVEFDYTLQPPWPAGGGTIYDSRRTEAANSEDRDPTAADARNTNGSVERRGGQCLVGGRFCRAARFDNPLERNRDASSVAARLERDYPTVPVVYQARNGRLDDSIVQISIPHAIAEL